MYSNTLIVHCHQGDIMIKEEPAAANVIVLSDSNKNQPENGTRWTNANLPFGSRKDNVWRRMYIPMYTTFVAGYKDPWAVSDDEAVEAMQRTWDKVYLNRGRTPDIQHQVVLNNAVFSIVCMAVL